MKTGISSAWKIKRSVGELIGFSRTNPPSATTIKEALEYIRYLFKDHAFRDEEEFRLLQIEEIGSDKVQYCPDTNTAFLEYGNVCTRLDEVILGTNTNAPIPA